MIARLAAWTLRGLAVAVVLVAVVAPLAGLLRSSLRVDEVVLPSGTALRVAGHVIRADGLVRFQAVPTGDPDGELVPVAVPDGPGVVERTRWSAVRYAEIWRSPRTLALLRHSVVLASGAALLALALGLPLAWALARTRLPGRRVLVPLLAAPLLLPPFFAAMGVSTSVGAGLEALGLEGGTLQLANAVVVFGALLFPIPALLVGRAWAGVPRGLWESARLLGGPRAAAARVTWPVVRPAVVASAALVFVVALCDFAVPDILGTFLPRGAVPVHVFATEIFLQWTKYGNVGRAVATGAPFVLVVLVLLLLAAWALRASPAGLRTGEALARAPAATGPLATALAAGLVLAVLALGVVLPVASVASWGFSPARVPATIRATVGLWDDAARWFRLGLVSAALATATAVVLARLAQRGGRTGRAVVAAAVGLPLAVPGLVLMVGTLLLWIAVPTSPDDIGKGVLVLVARALPYGVFAVLLAMREVGPGLEDAARLLGAGPATLARRIWGPMSARGILAAFCLLLVLAWRELDAIQLVVPGLLPVRIYDKVHFGRTAEVADLSLAYLGVLILPAVAAALLWPRRGDPPASGGVSDGDPPTAVPPPRRS